MNNEQVAHLWANKSRAEAKGSSFYFNGDTIYSYGHHFPIARHYLGAVLFTTKGYSSSTARHISITRSACHHLKVFTVADVLKGPGKDHLAEYRERIKEAALTAARARNPDFALQCLTRLVDEANEFAQHFGFVTRFAVPGETDLVALKAKAAASAARERKAAAAKQARQEAEAADAIRLWLAGDKLVTIPHHITKVYLRAKASLIPDETGACSPSEKTILETSKGASVPLAEAKLAFRFITSKRETGWHRNGETFKVGDFQLDAVNDQGVVAGCHRIGWDEIERFAKAQGWL